MMPQAPNEVRTLALTLTRTGVRKVTLEANFFKIHVPKANRCTVKDVDARNIRNNAGHDGRNTVSKILL